jgi:hypothetical protein
MNLRSRSSSLFWAAFLALGMTALVLRLRTPGHWALPWLGTALLTLLALRVLGMIYDWRRGQIPGPRILLPAVILAEGLGLGLSNASSLVLRLRLGTALVLEVLLLVLAVRALRSARSRAGAWPEDCIASAFEVFMPPRAARLMALELVMLGSATRFLFGGFRDVAPGGFSHHQESALRGILPAIPLLVPGDFLLLKVLFSELAPWLRWTLHGSTVYAVLWLIGYYATLKARPHEIREGMVHLHLGLLKTATFPASQVLSAAPLPDFSDDWARHAYMKGVQKLVAKGTSVLELKLSEPVQIASMLGPGRPTDRLAVSVDDPAAFIAALGHACA